ncbi:hypothetical protein [Tunicatimonas pelagia]|uniref:hypothetical protein n=1 Tax=Tunicatimonas pelagia TaxID=931531 RepID=UPI0026652737|nr:hypothetical protein [Tunicatimonas pelagia]WKN40465.1 hypothetical protein P0M28_15580 [Tunicatimonas pelagia]
MRTSLIETEQIEKYIQQRGDLSNRLLIEARMQVNHELAERVAFQKQTYRAIQEYGRQQLRAEICRVQRKVFSDSAYKKFQTKIRSYFKI